MFSILVKFDVVPEYKNTLIQVLREDGEGSLENESGTISFDVIQDSSNPNVIFLYEKYQNQAAFETHTQGIYCQKAIEILNQMTSKNQITMEVLGKGDMLFPIE
ncbi:MAG: putative quinol monooxygenase [Crocosphaera sp.]